MEKLKLIMILSHLLWAPMTETSPHWLEPLERGKALVYDTAEHAHKVFLKCLS